MTISWFSRRKIGRDEDAVLEQVLQCLARQYLIAHNGELCKACAWNDDRTSLQAWRVADEGVDVVDRGACTYVRRCVRVGVTDKRVDADARFPELVVVAALGLVACRRLAGLLRRVGSGFFDGRGCRRRCESGGRLDGH